MLHSCENCITSSERKMLEVIFALLSVALCCVELSPVPAPQDFQTAALLVAGQMKEVVENGAAARDERDVGFMGAKAGHNTALSFGDVMKMPARRRRREIESQALGAGNSMSFETDYSLCDYSYESEEFDSAQFVAKEQRKKRAALHSSSRSSSSRFSSSSSSSSSSSDSSSSSSSDESD